MTDVMLNWFRTQYEVRTQRMPRRAATMLEYVLIAGVILGVGALLATQFAQPLSNWFGNTGKQVNTSTTLAKVAP